MILPRWGRGLGQGARYGRADLPALKHLFPCNELTGDIYLTDIWGGVVLYRTIVGGIITNNGDGTISLSITYDGVLSGAWAAPNGKNMLVMYGGKPASTTSQVVIGGVSPNTEKGLRLSAAVTTPLPTSSDGVAALVNSVNPRPGNDALASYAVVAKYGDPAGLVQYAVDAGLTMVKSATPGDMSLQVSPVTLQAKTTIGQFSNPGIISVWHFTTLPSEAQIEDALIDQQQNVLALVDGEYRKRPFRGFAGMT
jgi:hypothetical protein